jgi:hypothetical protein
LDAELGAGVAPGEGAVAVAIVGEHAFDADALLRVPADGPAKESDAIVGPFAGQQLAVGEPGVIVDRQVQDCQPARRLRASRSP